VSLISYGRAGSSDRVSLRRHFPNASSSGPKRGRLAVAALASTQCASLPGSVMPALVAVNGMPYARSLVHSGNLPEGAGENS
jgi:hypothetical protein